MAEKIFNLLLVKEGERRKLIYFITLFLLFGCGMAIGRGSADALFFKRYGIQHLPLIYLIQGGLLFLVTIIYASYADRIAPERLLRPLVIIFCTLLFILWSAMTLTNSETIYPLYYLFYEMVSEIFIVHSMLYLSQNFNVLQSKRLTPIIWGGWQLGTIIGGVLLAVVAKQNELQTMLIVWMCILGLSVILVGIYHHKAGISPYHRSGRKSRYALKRAVEQLSQGIAFAKKSPMLRAMSLALFFMVITFYVLCYSVHRVYTQTFKSESELTVFYGILAATTGVVALCIQVFITNRLIRRYGVRRMNLVFPAITLSGFSVLLISFTLPAAIFASMVKDAIMPAIRNPVRAIFFNTLPSFMQGRSHAVSLGLVMPIALAAAGLTLMLAQQIKDVLYFLGLGMITALVYLYFNIQMNKSYVANLIDNLRQKLFVPDDTMKKTIHGDEDQALAILERASKDNQPDIRFAAAKTMLELFPERAGPIALHVLAGLHPPLKDQLFKMLEPLEPPNLRDYLWQELESDDAHLRATVLFILFKLRDIEGKALVAKALHDNNPRIRAMGIFGALTYPVPESTTDAIEVWKGLFANNDTTELFAALDLLKKWPNVEFADKLPILLESNDTRIQILTLQVVAQWPINSNQNLFSTISHLIHHKDPALRVSAAACIKRFKGEERQLLINTAIESDHPDVRRFAAAAMFPESCRDEEIVDWLVKNQTSPRAQTAVMHQFVARKPPRQYWERIAKAKADFARLFLEAHLFLTMAVKKKTLVASPVLDVLIMVLKERCHNYLDQALLAAKHYEDSETVSVIQAGLLSDDNRYFSSASEALSYIKDKALSNLLIGVLEKLAGEPVTRRKMPSPFNDHTTLIEWLDERRDPWINDCVQYMKA